MVYTATNPSLSWWSQLKLKSHVTEAIEWRKDCCEKCRKWNVFWVFEHNRNLTPDSHLRSILLHVNSGKERELQSKHVNCISHPQRNVGVSSQCCQSVCQDKSSEFINKIDGVSHTTSSCSVFSHTSIRTISQVHILSAQAQACLVILTYSPSNYQTTTQETFSLCLFRCEYE